MIAKKHKVYVDQMLDAARKIKKYTKDVGLKQFAKNEEKQSAVIMQLIIIGEISKKLSTAYKNQVDLPWKQIAGFRDRAVHKYFSLDVQNLWHTVESDIPELTKKLQVTRINKQK